jgi:hypothetical protein
MGNMLNLESETLLEQRVELPEPFSSQAAEAAPVGTGKLA